MALKFTDKRNKKSFVLTKKKANTSTTGYPIGGYNPAQVAKSGKFNRKTGNYV